MHMKVGIQGQAGSFHDYVANRWYGSECIVVPHTTFADMFESYAAGDIDAIVTAVENSIYGSINDVYGLIEKCEAPIVGEVKLSIDQCLIGTPEVPLTEITEIYSHPVALAQCRTTLRKLCPNAELFEYFDTAGAVEYVKSCNRPEAAAVAGQAAADLYNMAVIQSSVQDNKNNVTRFLILEPRASDHKATRSSLVVVTNHQPGSLVEVLEVFADAGVNLVKLQSQPIVGQPWKYKFFIVVDCAGVELRKLVNKIEKNDHRVTVLGEYKAA